MSEQKFKYLHNKNILLGEVKNIFSLFLMVLEVRNYLRPCSAPFNTRNKISDLKNRVQKASSRPKVLDGKVSC